MVGLVVDEELIRGLISQGFSIRISRIKGRLYLYAVKYLGPVSEEEAERVKRILEESARLKKAEPEKKEVASDPAVNLSDIVKRIEKLEEALSRLQAQTLQPHVAADPINLRGSQVDAPVNTPPPEAPAQQSTQGIQQPASEPAGTGDKSPQPEPVSQDSGKRIFSASIENLPPEVKRYLLSLSTRDYVQPEKYGVRPGRKTRGIVEKLADPSRSSYGYQLLRALSQEVERREVFEFIVREMAENYKKTGDPFVDYDTILRVFK